MTTTCNLCGKPTKRLYRTLDSNGTFVAGCAACSKKSYEAASKVDESTTKEGL